MVSTFVSVQAGDIDLGADVYVGLFVCSHEDEVIETAEFHDVRIVKPVADGFERGKDPFGSHMEILDIASGHRRIIHSQDHVFEAPNWMRDGKALIYNAGGRLFRFDLATGARTPIDTGDVVRNNNDHVISFDGTMLAISSHGGAKGASLVYTVPVGGGQPKLVTPTGPSYLHGWSADGAYLTYTGERNGQYDIYRIPAEWRAKRSSSPTRPVWTTARSTRRTGRISTSTRSAAGACRSGGCGRMAARPSN